MTPTLFPAFIGVGANLGEPVTTVRAAITALGQLDTLQGLRTSSLYRTAPVGPGTEGQPDYINAVVSVQTSLNPRALLEVLFALEARFGRQRSMRNAARTLDLDLLLYGNCTIDEADLQLPHPRMAERAFVLQPLAELAPDVVIPGQGKVAELARTLADQGVRRL